jgi:uncharacterized RDD family membrane protein YckC
VKLPLSFIRLLILGLLLAFPLAARAQIRRDDLLAHGSDDRFWIARYEPAAANHSDASPRTMFYFRGPGDTSFQRFPLASNGHILTLANRGTQLAALLQGRDWVMASETGTLAEGPPLPNGAVIVDLAGAEDTFWAIGTAGILVTAPTTASAVPATITSAASATTFPATTQSITVPPAFFKLEDGVWKAIVPFPAGILLGSIPPSLAILDHVPYIAFAQGLRTVRVIRYEGSDWKTVSIFSGQDPVVGVRLLRGTPSPVVWIGRQKAADTLDFLSDFTPPRHVTLSFVPATSQYLSVACAMGHIRVLFGTEKSLSEQDLDASTGAISGGVTALAFQTEVSIYSIVHISQYVIWTALFLAILGAIRFRRQMLATTFDLEKIHLAPLGRRLSAGVIDLFPLVIGIAIMTGPVSDQAREIVLAASVSVYLLHTALGEMFAGRSLGKWLMGLRVVNLTGERPNKLLLLLRNLLRVIDIGLLFVPLIVVLLSPLRQRTGDVAAGTLVVRAD